MLGVTQRHLELSSSILDNSLLAQCEKSLHARAGKPLNHGFANEVVKRFAQPSLREKELDGRVALNLVLLAERLARERYDTMESLHAHERTTR